MPGRTAPGHDPPDPPTTMTDDTPVDALRQCLQRAGLGPDDTLLLACSGGRDSQVLMHAVAALRPVVRAAVAHVHHGLQSRADDWLAFCAAEASSLGLPFLSRRLRVSAGFGALGLEAWARAGRYRALADMAAEIGARVVLTAHHANDQLETVELRRRRGSGLLGLAGMRESSPMPHAPAGMRVLRPFLGLSRQQLAEWAQQRGIQWVEDPSNQDTRLARNRVRRFLDRRLRDDALSLPDELASIGLLQQAADRLLGQAEADVAACTVHLASHTAAADWSMLSRSAMMGLDSVRRAEALRWWLGRLGCRMPSRLKLFEIERQLLLAAASQALVRHDGITLLRYRDRIGVLPEVPPITPLLLRWKGETFVDLPAGRLYIEQAGPEQAIHTDASDTVDADWLSRTEILIDQGRGGERLRLSPSSPSRSWKKLMQARGIPACLRACLPVIRADGQPIHAAPFGLLADMPCDAHAAHGSSGPRVQLSWQPAAALLPWL